MGKRIVPNNERRHRLSRILIISEKPTAARRIAEALDQDGSPVEIKKRKVSYYECRRNGDTLLVVYALGHLFELRQTEKGWTYPRLSTEWVPKYEVSKKATDIKPIINLIRKISKDVDHFVVATDYDIEGSLIGYLTLKHACRADPKQAKRMVFSTLTRTELGTAYENMTPTLDFPMIEAGHARHEMDWLYGVNLTRALTLAIKNASGWFKIVSTGRVQGPALAFVAERDREINVFVPTPFWTILATGSSDGHDFELEYSVKRINVKKDADDIVDELQDETAIVESITAKKISQKPPVPFNLSGLQSESYRHFGFKPSRTMGIAQKLYLDALISYPRTGSQKIPPSIDVKGILGDLREQRKYRSLATQVLDRGNLTPVQGKKDDPAHPAIHPTGTMSERRLTPSESKVYDLIVRRFMALFGEAAVKEKLRADIKSGVHLFYLRGLKVLKLGWMAFYDPYVKHNERLLPPVGKGDEVSLTSVTTETKHTSSPPRFNPSSLLKLLEKENLGTKATRASIVDSVRSRGYTLGDRFEVSTLGYALFETLNQYVPEILSAEFTRGFELEMESIQAGKTDRQNVLGRVGTELVQLLERFKGQEEVIGEALVSGLQRYWKAKEEVGSCSKCGIGTLTIVRSPKTGKRFVGCTQYKEGGCDQTFPLPQKGNIKPLDKECPHCGHRMMKVSSGRRAWETCINWAECPGRQDDLKTLQEKREKAARSVREEGTDE
ncbi:MAG: DNA topoisomerase I [Candidatus Thorarchaeota archaeon]